MKENIIVSSITGNTKMLADCLDTLNLRDDVLYVGFWTDKGKADEKTLKYLKELRNKKIFLFGTCGFGLSESYFNGIIDKTTAFIDPSNDIVGSFVCMGKMQQRVRDRYVNSEIPNKEMLIKNFDEALKHPNEEDLERLKEEVNKI